MKLNWYRNVLNSMKVLSLRIICWRHLLRGNYLNTAIFSRDCTMNALQLKVASAIRILRMKYWMKWSTQRWSFMKDWECAGLHPSWREERRRRMCWRIAMAKRWRFSRAMLCGCPRSSCKMILSIIQIRRYSIQNVSVKRIARAMYLVHTLPLA